MIDGEARREHVETMHILGHMVWGYIVVRATCRAAGVKPPPTYVVLIFSVLPDFDLFFSAVGWQHRYGSHSIVIWAPILLAAVMMWRRRALPYVVAVLQHIFLGDVPLGLVPLVWPVSDVMLGLDIPMQYPDAVLELGGLGGSAWIAYKAGDIRKIISRERGNILMAVPLLLLVVLSLIYVYALGSSVPEYFSNSSSDGAKYPSYFVLGGHAVLAGLLLLSILQGLAALARRKT